MVPVSYIVTAIVSAAFGSVTTIFMLSITAAAKKADEEEDKLFCEYLKGKKMEWSLPFVQYHENRSNT